MRILVDLLKKNLTIIQIGSRKEEYVMPWSGMGQYAVVHTRLIYRIHQVYIFDFRKIIFDDVINYFKICRILPAAPAGDSNVPWSKWSTTSYFLK